MDQPPNKDENGHAAAHPLVKHAAELFGGTVTNGQAMQAVVVPEPDAFLLGGLGLALIGLALGRRRSLLGAQAT